VWPPFTTRPWKRIWRIGDASLEVHRLLRFLFSRELNNDIFSFLIPRSDLVKLTRFPDTLYIHRVKCESRCRTNIIPDRFYCVPWEITSRSFANKLRLRVFTTVLSLLSVWLRLLRNGLFQPKPRGFLTVVLSWSKFLISDRKVNPHIPTIPFHEFRGRRLAISLTLIDDIRNLQKTNSPLEKWYLVDGINFWR
jgi:hypothetical protein